MCRCTTLRNVKEQNWRYSVAFNTTTQNLQYLQTGHAKQHAHYLSYIK